MATVKIASDKLEDIVGNGPAILQKPTDQISLPQISKSDIANTMNSQHVSQSEGMEQQGIYYCRFLLRNRFLSTLRNIQTESTNYSSL